MKTIRSGLNSSHDNSPLSMSGRRVCEDRLTEPPLRGAAGLSTERAQPQRDLKREGLHRVCSIRAQSDRRVSSEASTAGKMERLLGRSSGSRITLLAAPSRESDLSGVCGVRPRLQRRDRDGFKPSSLFSRSNTPQAPKSPGMVSPARGIATNAVRRAERPVEQRRVSLQLARFLAVKTGKRDAYPTFFNWLLGWFV